jgi:hypothetical protein
MCLFMYASQFPMDDLLDSEQGSSPSIVSFFIGTAEYVDGTYVPFVHVAGVPYVLSIFIFLYIPKRRLTRLHLTAILEVPSFHAPTAHRARAAPRSATQQSRTRLHLPTRRLSLSIELARWFPRKRYVNDTGGGCVSRPAREGRHLTFGKARLACQCRTPNA